MERAYGKSSASLAAASLQPLDPPVPLATLKAAVEQESYPVREDKVAEFDDFCDRMRVDDYTTPPGTRRHVGRLVGLSRLETQRSLAGG